MANLAKLYRTEVIKKLIEQFKYQSPMEAPRLVKITLNMGVGEAVADKKILTAAIGDLTKISGQEAYYNTRKKICFYLQDKRGWPIGCKVTLRKARMYDFLEKLIGIVIPRVRDFRGLSKKSFDGRGNYSLGLKEQIVFPEINYDEIDALRGLDVTITTTAKTDREAYALLKAFNFPFKDEF